MDIYFKLFNNTGDWSNLTILFNEYHDKKENKILFKALNELKNKTGENYIRVNVLFDKLEYLGHDIRFISFGVLKGMSEDELKSFIINH